MIIFRDKLNIPESENKFITIRKPMKGYNDI